MYVCLFDIDGTLLSSGGAGRAAMEAALAEEFNLKHVRSVNFSGRTDRAICFDLLRLHGIPDTEENWEILSASYLRRLPDHLRKHEGKVLPGIRQLLSDLQKRPDVAIGLLTGNIRAGARVKLGHFDLYESFSFGGFGDHHWERDDVAREAWAEVRKRFNGSVPAERVWVIGDTPLDVQCARAIGAKIAAVATGFHSLDDLRPTEPDLLLQDLAEPQTFLNLLV